MNIPPNPPDQPSVFRRYGCLIVIVAVFTLVVVAALFAYHAVVGTSLPYRMVASMIQKANPNIKIEGITGDLKTGLGVSSITWGDDPAHRSEILDLRIRYNGYNDASKSHRVVIRDAGVRKAHIDLADFPQWADSTTTTTTTTTSSGSSTTTTTTTTSSGVPYPSSMDTLEIERVSIEDVLITNRLTDFRLSIPKIEWTGFKATPTSYDPGVLTIESDRLMLHTTAGRTVPVEGRDITFQKTLTGTAQPTLHPAIKQPIAFTADVSFTRHGDLRPFHVVAAEGKLEVIGTKEGGGSVQARHLDLAGFIEPGKFFGDHAADLPSDLVLNAVVAPGFSDGHGAVKIAGGSFRLGVSTFQIEPVEFTKAEQSGAILQAVLKTEAGNIVWALPLAKIGEEYHPHFISPGLAPAEVLAHVFFGRAYPQLGAEDKAAVDARVPTYFPAVGK